MPGESARSRPSNGMTQKARDVLARHDAQCLRMTSTASVEQIAREENVRPSTVWNWISVARGGPTAVGEAPETSLPDPEPRPPPKPMSERVIAGRAWLTWHLDERFLRLEARAIIFWTQMVVAVHRLGDGFGLNFSEAGFDDRADFATSCRGDERALAMLARRRLIEDHGDAIALPRGLGLTPRERVGGKLIPRSAPDRRQGSLGPMALPSPHEPESNRSPDRSPDRSQPESGAEDSGNAGFDSSRSPSGVRLAGGESTTTTTTKRQESLLLGGGLVTAGEREEPPDSDRTPVVDSGRTPVAPPAAAPPLPHVTLAAELTAITGRPGQATPADLNAVRECLDSGGTPDGFRKFVEGRMTREKLRADPPTLSWLAKGYLDVVRNPRPAIPIAPAPVPAAPEPPEDPAATIRLLHDDPDNPRVAAAWAPARASLRAELGEGAWHLCRNMILGGLEGDEIVILLQTSFACDQVRERYGPRVEALLLKGYPEARRVEFRVHAPAAP